MRRYLSTLHKKPEHHRKRFAFLVSAGFTMSIFTVWSLVMFGTGEGAVMADRGQRAQLAAEEEQSPLGTVRSGMAAALESIRQDLGLLKRGIESVDFQGEYGEMRSRSIEIYNGR